jgi:hypothetical protein
MQEATRAGARARLQNRALKHMSKRIAEFSDDEESPASRQRLEEMEM